MVTWDELLKKVELSKRIEETERELESARKLKNREKESMLLLLLHKLRQMEGGKHGKN